MAKFGFFGAAANLIYYTPPWLRWDPEAHYEMPWGLNILAGFVAAFGVANLYYTHPILNILAADFGVSNERVSLVPTVLQAGYAAGLLFVCPIGDLVRRRPLILLLSFLTAMVWLACTLTTSFEAFMGLSFLVGIFAVSPQLMFPLAIQFAPPRHRATMVAIIMSGITFGMLIARLLSGIVTQYTHWRVVFWLSFALQLSLIPPLILLVPDFPVLRPDGRYLESLLRILRMPLRHPLLLQQALIAFLIMAMFTSFWTTLTFQLSGHFHLSAIIIGLFALVGLTPLFVGPLVSRLIMTRLHPQGALIGSHVLLLAVIAVGTFVGAFSLAGPIIWASLGDLAMNVIVISNRLLFAGVDPTAQNAVNSVYMVFCFSGQLFGTAVGNKLYADGGWIRSGVFSIGVVGGGLLLSLVRGPHEKRWLGWRGGWELRIRKITEAQSDGSASPGREK